MLKKLIHESEIYMDEIINENMGLKIRYMTKYITC